MRIVNKSNHVVHTGLIFEELNLLRFHDIHFCQLDQFINYISFATLIFSQNLATIPGMHFLSTYHTAEQISDKFLFSFRVQRLFNTLSSEITSATSRYPEIS